MTRRRGGSIYRRGGALWLKYYRAGQPIRESVAKTINKAAGDVTESDARALLNKRLGLIAGGQPIAIHADRVRLSELLDDLLTEYGVNGRRSIERARASVAHLREFFGEARAQSIDTARVRTYVATRQAKGISNATINRELACLKRAYSLAAKAGTILTRPHIPMLVEHNTRKGFFEADQFRAALAELPEYLRGLFEVAYVTGWRVESELLSRDWSHVDFTAGWLRLDPGETKNGEGRMFPLTPALRATLERLRADTDERQRATHTIIRPVFHRAGERIKDFRRAWRGAMKRAGLGGLIPHDLRRTAVRNLERAGIPRSAAMKLVGHQTEAIYRRYAIADEGMLREAGAKLEALHASESSTPRTVVPITAARTER